MRVSGRIVAFVIVFLAMSLRLAAGADDAEKSITAWKNWKSIDAAIALKPLDGPSDIMEKVEIIEDRLDELIQEQNRIEKENQVSQQLIQSWNAQKDMLRDLSNLRQGNDFQSRQRLYDFTERITREEKLAKLQALSLADLAKEIRRLKTLAEQYKQKAEHLRIKEGNAP